jgi:hypothetical protein
MRPVEASRLVPLVLVLALAAGGFRPAPVAAAPPETAAAPRPAPLDAATAERLFARFAALSGDWATSSTRGWTGHHTYALIANGSVVMGLAEFDDAPGHGMATMFHLDSGRLLLTHYCEARNQPRLLATWASPDLSEVEFTFVDATNLRSRDQGHMDRARYRFLDADRYTSRWTWYADGEERWMEEIESRRLTGGGAAAGR